MSKIAVKSENAGNDLFSALLLLLLAVTFMNRVLVPPTGQVIAAHDVQGQFYPWLLAAQQALRQGKLLLWNPFQFSGYPFLSNPQVGFFYPPTWLALLLPVNVGISLYLVFHIWLAAFGMYLFVRSLYDHWLGAMLAAITFGFSGFVAARIWAGHIGFLATAAWLPWSLLAVTWCVRRQDARSTVIAGLPLGLAFLSGSPPSFFYVAVIWLAYSVYLIWEAPGGRGLATRQVVLMGLAGAGFAAVQLIPFVQFGFTSLRAAKADFEFATEFSMPPAHLITLVLPEFFGEPTRIGYWSVPNFEELTYYSGLLAFLGLIMAIRKPNRLTWFLVAIMLTGLILALGRYSPLYRLLFDLFPPLRLIRAPGRATFLFLFGITVLLGSSFARWQRIPEVERDEALGPLLKWALALASIAGIAALAATGAVFLSLHPSDTSGRLWHQIGGYAVALLLLLVGGALTWGYFSSWSGQSVRHSVLAAALIVVVLCDLWFFGYKFISLAPIDMNEVWSDAKLAIGETNSRVLPWALPLFSQNGAMEVGLTSVFGYDSLQPADHIALTSSVPDPRSTAYDVLAVDYVLSDKPLEEYMDGEGALALMAHQGSAWVYRRPQSVPIVRVVHEYEVISEWQRAIARLHEPEFDAKSTAILSAAPDCEIGREDPSPSTAEVLERQPGYWRIRTNSATDALLLVAETDYPGWRALVDGNSAKSLTAYTTIHAVCIPAGTHVVEWVFRPTVFVVSGAITLVMLVLAAIALVRIWLGRRRAHAAYGPPSSSV